MFSAAVHYGQYPNQQDHSLMALPLNLIALIVSHLDDVSDLARLCRTCRVLNYMTLPQLYKTFTLTSYDKIRYRDDRPEGCGSASPFSMALNAVVTRNVGALVNSMTLRGEWRESELEEHARVGRVPDSSMMLNIAVRAAVDRMNALESFSWELNTKMLETVYLGLSQLPKLTSLSVRFPSSRHPRPTTMIPPMPHLRVLKIKDIDPLCYPDDISTLLHRSRKLRDLRLHWSPRMRDEQEATVKLHDYFRKCIAAKSPLALRKVSLYNFYALHSEEFKGAVDPLAMEEVTILMTPSSGARDDSSVISFVDSSWPMPSDGQMANVKSFRHDRADRRFGDFLNSFQRLEKLYYVNHARDPGSNVNDQRYVPLCSSTAYTPSDSDGPGPPAGSWAISSNGYPIYSANSPTNPLLTSQAAIRDGYLQSVMTVQGPRMRHLLLPSHWPLSAPTIARLVRSCPNLEQLALATDLTSFDTVGILIPFLRKLAALRILVPTVLPQSAPNSRHDTPGALLASNLSNMPNQFSMSNGTTATTTTSGSNATQDAARVLAALINVDDRIHIETLAICLADKEIHSSLKVLGMGWKAWELGDFYSVRASESTFPFHWIDENTLVPNIPRATEHGGGVTATPNTNGTAFAGTGTGPSKTDTPAAGSTTAATEARPFMLPKSCRGQGHATALWTPQISAALGKRKAPSDEPEPPFSTHPPPQQQQQQQHQHQHQHQQHPPASPSPQGSSSMSTSTSATAATSMDTHQAALDCSGTTAGPAATNGCTTDNVTLPGPPSRTALNLRDALRDYGGENLPDEFLVKLAQCVPHLETNEVFTRRRIRRVGWEVLKNWEIWGQDTVDV
ncbi:hypothetical protein AJ80_00665 [Polytolypa hystricis UAMH7299]|uniref:F-box domain-containing protein n=1 Tax=Polytolypa hystricis (strain UAMH7299) TaxID=1447883 RepID=A0A2B7Z3L5_POLH7|nr:hypothetical protein AJ80_00665 [Polytolypa hystricis UAMH7299]